MTEAQFAELCQTLDQWIASAKAKRSARGTRHRYRIGVAFFPLALGLAAGLTNPATGQTDPRRRAADLITEADVRHRIDLIAADSMRGRNTPSPELEQTAEYLARVFESAGLTPLGDSGRYLQRYPLVEKRLVPERSVLTFEGPGGPTELRFGPTLAFAQGSVPSQPLTGPVILLGGNVTPEGIVPDSVRGRAVFWLVDLRGPGARSIDGVAGALIGAKPAFVVLVPNDTLFVRGAAARQARPRIARPEASDQGGFTALTADPATLATVPALARAASQAQAGTGTTFVPAGVVVTLRLADSVVAPRSAPNVVGVVRGTDPTLSREYVVVSAHMDHLGVESGAAPDSIYNGADDNGSGTVAVLEIARALGQTGIRPKRSVIVTIVSGEEKGLWGSEWFVTHPPVPLASIVADVNLDMVGRNWRDTLGVIGRPYSNLGQMLDQVAARHADLRMTPVDDRWPDQNRFYRSDHYNFAKRGVPILFLSSGYAPEYHEVGDSPDKIDAEKLARVAKLVYYFALDLADRPDRPAWDEASRRKIVQ